MLPKLFGVSTIAAGLVYLAASEPIRHSIPDRVKLSPHAATCTPNAGGSPTIDDVPAIDQLSFAGCSGCTFKILGELSVSTDFNYWNGKGEIIHLQGITGARITGSGMINGNGQASWDYFASNSSYKRPYLIRVDDSSNIQMSRITLKDAPMFHVVTSGNSKNVVYSDMNLYSVSNSSNVAHNTDGFDIGPASYVTVQNTQITNNDDCVVLKPGASYVTATGITCVGSHGLSVGSLAGGANSDDIVTNSIFKNCTMSGSTKAAGIKYYPGGTTHGTGIVSNVTWEDIFCDSCNYAIQIETCYSSNSTYCAQYPSTGQISDVVFSGFSGTTSGHYKDVVANIDCSSAGTCGMVIGDFSVVAPDEASKVLCTNTPSDLGVTCTAGASG